MTTAQATLLRKAIHEHDRANEQLGCGDPEPHDRAAMAFIKAFQLVGGNDKKWDTWEDARQALKEYDA